jgi:hypothetical protein
MLPFPMLDAHLHQAAFEIEPLVRRVLAAMLKGTLGE